MTVQEIGKLLSVAEGAYPEKTAFWDDSVKSKLVTAWKLVLGDYSYEEGSTALAVYLRSDKYNRFPGAGQIVDIIENLKESAKPDFMTPQEAWAIVRPAIRRGLYYSEEEFEKFPDIVKEAVVDPARLREWAQLPSETIDSVEKSNFCNRIFPGVVNRHRESDRLPVNVREMIEKKRVENKALEEQKVKSVEAAGDERKLIEYKPSGLDHSKERAKKIHDMREEFRKRRQRIAE